MSKTEELLSLKDVVRRTGLPPWKIQRLLTYGGVEDVPRCAGKRVFTDADVRRIIVAVEAQKERRDHTGSFGDGDD